MTLFRYLSKSVLHSSLAILAILVFIFLSIESIRYLSQAAAGQMAVLTMFQLMLFEIPLLSGYLLPMSFFLGLLLTLGRWTVDWEMIGLMACGMSRKTLIMHVILLASFVAGIVAYLVLLMGPQLENYRARTLERALIKDTVAKILPMQFQRLGNTEGVFYTTTLSADHKKMNRIFLAKMSEGGGDGSWDVALASEASEWRNEKNQRFLLFIHGMRYEGKPGQFTFSKTAFNQYGVILSPDLFKLRNRVKNQSMTQLWLLRLHNLEAAAEWQWRISLPISVWLFALLAIPLSRGYSHRKLGKFASILPAILIYFVYINLIFAGRSWIENGWNSKLGLWWMHGSLFLLAMLLLFFQSVWKSK